LYVALCGEMYMPWYGTKKIRSKNGLYPVNQLTESDTGLQIKVLDNITGNTINFFHL